MSILLFRCGTPWKWLTVVLLVGFFVIGPLLGLPGIFWMGGYILGSTRCGVDRDQLKRLQARYASRAGPIGLTPEELDFENMPQQIDVHGIPVKAQIRFQDCSKLIDVVDHTWTANAVQVSWSDGPLQRSTWVWASAVTRATKLNRTLGELTQHDSSTD